jgi:hypothetical protein
MESNEPKFVVDVGIENLHRFLILVSLSGELEYQFLLQKAASDQKQ